MENLKRKSLLILGIFVGTFLIFESYCVADSNKESQLSKMELILTDFTDIENSILSVFEVEKKLIKVYSSTDKLVYETKNPDDKKLEQLIHKSDYLTEISNTIYYKLSR